MEIKPLHDKVILEVIKEEEKTKSGIVLPDTIDKEKPEEAKVVAVGPGRVLNDGKLVKPSVKKGQKVIFKKYSADEIKIKDKEYLVISEEDILAVIGK